MRYVLCKKTFSYFENQHYCIQQITKCVFMCVYLLLLINCWCINKRINKLHENKYMFCYINAYFMKKKDKRYTSRVKNDTAFLIKITSSCIKFQGHLIQHSNISFINKILNCSAYDGKKNQFLRTMRKSIEGHMHNLVQCFKSYN